MLAPLSREVHVGQRTKSFTIAASATILDVVVAARCGGVVWRTWSGVLWLRVALLLLAALWATSLATLWSSAYNDLRFLTYKGGVAVTEVQDRPRRTEG